jgi:Sensors of blue-light using FAD
MFERIAYVSRALATTGLREVYDIVRVANNRNAELGLTGALIFLDGCFLQVIEGLPGPLNDRFAIIAADSRHTEVCVRVSAKITTLAFPETWMALRQGDAILEATKRAFGYQPGFPSDAFDGDKLVAFALACCAAHSIG